MADVLVSPSISYRRAYASMYHAAHKTLLAIRCVVPGRAMPTSKIFVEDEVRLRDVMSAWAQGVMKAQRGELPAEARVTGRGASDNLDLDLTLRVLKPQLPVREGRLTIFVLWPAEPRPQADATARAPAPAAAAPRDAAREKALEKAQREKKRQKELAKKERRKLKEKAKKEKHRLKAKAKQAKLKEDARKAKDNARAERTKAKIEARAKRKATEADIDSGSKDTTTASSASSTSSSASSTSSDSDSGDEGISSISRFLDNVSGSE